jgi:hypothetical protein
MSIAEFPRVATCIDMCMVIGNVPAFSLSAFHTNVLLLQSPEDKQVIIVLLLPDSPEIYRVFKSSTVRHKLFQYMLLQSPEDYQILLCHLIVKLLGF